MATGRHWHLLTGEYPPQMGGVADYTEQIAAGLARAGHAVHVWSPPVEQGPTPEHDGVAVRREAGRWHGQDLRRIGRGIEACPHPRRLLVQYTPFAWGLRGLNAAFPRWLAGRRRRGDDVWTMIHEAAYPFRPNETPLHWALAATNRLMLRGIIRASTRLYHGMLPHVRLIRRCGRGLTLPPMTWRPVPSNIPVADDPEGVRAVRTRIAPAGGPIIGHFGSFSWSNDAVLEALLPHLLAGRADRAGLLIGRNSAEFAASLVRRYPELSHRLTGTGTLPRRDASVHLQACDVMVQPYMDGVSTRRGSLMAGLAHGRPIVTNLGHSTDPVWTGSGCVALVPSDDPGSLAKAVETLIDDPEARTRLERAALRTYRERFAVERTLETLLADAAAADQVEAAAVVL